MKYVSPESGLKAFTCPHCGVLARQYHYYSVEELKGGQYSELERNPVRVSKCEHCGQICLWHFSKLVHPNRGSTPPPNPDMPEEVKKDYEEAASICMQCPRGAAALIRLAIQKICPILGGKGKDINEDIKTLVSNGLPTSVQQALDVVRVIGNNAVHPGQIDVDNGEVVGKLFALVNVICEYMISMPKKVSGLYEALPEGSKKAIEKRDGK